jgi:Tat protein secretion system quality control protein TatD with DNase activity
MDFCDGVGQVFPNWYTPRGMRNAVGGMANKNVIQFSNQKIILHCFSSHVQTVHLFFPMGLNIRVRFFSPLSSLVSLPKRKLNNLVFSKITTQCQIQVA